MKQNRKLTALAAAALMTASFLTAPLAAFADYPFQTNCSYYYDNFDTEAQKLYFNLLASARMVDESTATYFEAPEAMYGDMTYEQVKDVVEIFTYDHPEFFWLANHYSISYSSYHFSGGSVILDVYPEYQDGYKRQEAHDELVAVAQDYINGAKQYNTDYDRANYLSNRLYSDISYVTGDLDQSIASALLQKQTVCAGFSKAYSMLANAVGVETITLQSPEHAWNVTKIADVWYHDDVTNDLFFYSDAQMDTFDVNATKTRVTYDDGTSKVFRMHELERSYYFDLRPLCPQSYDGSYTILSGSPEPTTEPYEPDTTEPYEPDTTEPYEPDTTEPSEGSKTYYAVDPVEAFYYADDTTEFDLYSLVDTLWCVEESWTGNSHSTTKTSVRGGAAALSLYDSVSTPAKIMEIIEQDGESHVYYGPLPVDYNGEIVEIENIYVVHRGDFDGNGVVNAVDAAEVLIYSAARGSGNTPELPAGVNEKAARFAAKLTANSSDLNAADAAEILILAAKIGAGEVG